MNKELIMKKGMLNQHVHVNRSSANVRNIDNAQVFSRILSGEADSEMMDYLLNMGNMRMHDVKSIAKYNSMNLAAILNQAAEYNDLHGKRELVLMKPKQKIRSRLDTLYNERSSVRAYSCDRMSFEDFSTVCHYAFGTAYREIYFDDTKVRLRHYPSGGGLYPVDVNFYVKNVDDIPDGIYRYQVNSHSLFHLVNDFDVKEFLNFGSFDFENMAFLVLYGYSVHKTYLKYGELSLLNVLIETGNMCFALDLMLTEFGYGSCQIAGFDKAYVERILNLDGVDSHIIFTQICGKI